MQDIIQKITANTTPWFLNHGVKILVIFAAAWLIRRFGGIFIEKVIRKIVVSDHFLTKEAEKKREDTLMSKNQLLSLEQSRQIIQSMGINPQKTKEDESVMAIFASYQL